MRSPVKRAAARRIIFGGTANWAIWDALDAARSEDDPMKLYTPMTPWRSHIDFQGGLTTQVAT